MRIERDGEWRILLSLLGRGWIPCLENLLIVIVEAGQKLEGPRGCCLHRVRVLIGGNRYAAGAAVATADATAGFAATAGTGTCVTDAVTGVMNAVASAGDGDDATNPIADLLPLHHRLYFLPLQPTQQLPLQRAIDAEELTDRACVKHRHRYTNGEHTIRRMYASS